jgi:hypothetical protein
MTENNHIINLNKVPVLVDISVLHPISYSCIAMIEIQ